MRKHEAMNNVIPLRVQSVSEPAPEQPDRLLIIGVILLLIGFWIIAIAGIAALMERK